MLPGSWETPRELMLEDASVQKSVTEIEAEEQEEIQMEKKNTRKVIAD